MGAACGVCGKSDDTAHRSPTTKSGETNDDEGSSSKEGKHQHQQVATNIDNDRGHEDTTFRMRPEGRGEDLDDVVDEYSRPATPSVPSSPTTTNKNFSPNTRRPQHHLPALEVKHNNKSDTASSFDLGSVVADATYTNMPGRVQSEEQTSALVRGDGRGGNHTDGGEDSSDAESDTLDRKRVSSTLTPNKNMNPLTTPQTQRKAVQGGGGGIEGVGASSLMGAQPQPTNSETPRRVESDDETGGSSTCSGFSSRRGKGRKELAGFEADGPLHPNEEDSSHRTSAAHTRSSSGLGGASGSTIIMAGSGGGPSPSSLTGRRRNSATIPPEQVLPNGRGIVYPSPPHSGDGGDGRRAISNFTGNPLLAPSAQSAANALSRLDPRLLKLLETASEVIKCAGEGDLVGLSNLVHSHGKTVGTLRKRALIPTSATMFLQCFAAPSITIVAAPVRGGRVEDDEENPFTGAVGRELSIYSSSSSHHRRNLVDTLRVNSEKNLSSLRVNDLSASDLESIATGATESDQDDDLSGDDDDDHHSDNGRGHRKHSHKHGKKGSHTTTKSPSVGEGGNNNSFDNNHSVSSVNNNNTSSSNIKTPGSTLMKDALKALTSSQYRLSRNHSNLSRPSPQTGGSFHHVASTTSSATRRKGQQQQHDISSSPGGGTGNKGWVGGNGDLFMASTSGAVAIGGGSSTAYRGGGGLAEGSALDTEIQEKLVYHSRLVADCINGTPLIFSNNTHKSQQQKPSSANNNNRRSGSGRNSEVELSKPQERQRRKWLYQLGILYDDEDGDEVLSDDIPDVLLPLDAPIHAAARSGNADIVAYLTRYTSKTGLMEGWQLPHLNKSNTKKNTSGSSLPPTPSLSPRSQQLSPATSHHNIQHNSNVLGGVVFLDEGPLGGNQQNGVVGSPVTPTESRSGSPSSGRAPQLFRPPSANPFGGGNTTVASTTHTKRPSSRLSGAGFRNDTPINDHNPPSASLVTSRHDSNSYEGGGGGGMASSINSLSLNNFHPPTTTSPSNGNGGGGGVASSLINFMMDAVRVSTQPTTINNFPNGVGAINPLLAPPPRPRSTSRGHEGGGGGGGGGVEFSTDMIEDDGSSSDALLSGTGRSLPSQQHLNGTGTSVTSGGLPPLPRLVDGGDFTSNENSPQANAPLVNNPPNNNNNSTTPWSLPEIGGTIGNNKLLLASNTSRPTSAQQSPSGHTPLMPPPRPRSRSDHRHYNNINASAAASISKVGINEIHLGRSALQEAILSGRPKAVYELIAKHGAATTYPGNMVVPAAQLSSEIYEYADRRLNEIEEELYEEEMNLQQLPTTSEESERTLAAIQKLQDQRVHWTRIYDYGSQMLPSSSSAMPQPPEIMGMDMMESLSTTDRLNPHPPPPHSQPSSPTSLWAGAFLLSGLSTLPKLKSGMDFDASKGLVGDHQHQLGNGSAFDDDYDLEEESPASTVGGRSSSGKFGMSSSSRRGLPDIGIAKQLQTLRGGLIAPVSTIYDSSIPPPSATHTTTTTATTSSPLPSGTIVLPSSRHRHVTPHITLVAASTLCSPAAKLDGTGSGGGPGGISLTSKGPMSSASLRHRVVEFPQVYRVCDACRAADGNKVFLDARQLNATAFGHQGDSSGGDGGGGQSSPPPTSGKGSQIRTHNILAVAASGGHARTATGRKGGGVGIDGAAHLDEYTGPGIEPASNDADVLFGIIPPPQQQQQSATTTTATNNSTNNQHYEEVRQQLQQQLVPVFCPFCCVEEQPLHTAVTTGSIPIVLLLLETVVTAVCNVFGGGSDGASGGSSHGGGGKAGKGSAEASAALAAAAAGRQRSAGGGSSSTSGTAHYIEAMIEAGCTTPLERLRFLQQNRRKAAVRSGGSSAGRNGGGAGGGEGSLPEGYLRMLGLSSEGLRIIGAFVNMRRFRDGFTALHIAASAGNNVLVKLLLEHNADPFVRATPISLEFATVQLPPLAELIPDASSHHLLPPTATSSSSSRMTTPISAAQKQPSPSNTATSTTTDPAAALLSQFTQRYVLLNRFKGISASEAANSAVASYLKLQGAALRIQHGASSSSSTVSPRGGGVTFLGSKAKKASQAMQTLIMGGPMLQSHQLHSAADNNNNNPQRPASRSIGGGGASSSINGASNLAELFQLNRSKTMEKERQGLGSRGSVNGGGTTARTSSSMGATTDNIRTQSSMSGGGGGPRVVQQPTSDAPPTPPSSQLRQSSFARQQADSSARHQRLSGSAHTSQSRNSGSVIRSTGELPPLKR